MTQAQLAAGVNYALVQADIDAEGLENKATASGTSRGGTVTDLSDDDGGPGENDPTLAPIVQTPSLAG